MVLFDAVQSRAVWNRPSLDLDAASGDTSKACRAVSTTLHTPLLTIRLLKHNHLICSNNCRKSVGDRNHGSAYRKLF